MFIHPYHLKIKRIGKLIKNIIKPISYALLVVIVLFISLFTYIPYYESTHNIGNKNSNTIPILGNPSENCRIINLNYLDTNLSGNGFVYLVALKQENTDKSINHLYISDFKNNVIDRTNNVKSHKSKNIEPLASFQVKNKTIIWNTIDIKKFKSEIFYNGIYYVYWFLKFKDNKFLEEE